MKIEIFNETKDNLDEYTDTIKKVLVHGLDKLNKEYRNIDRETDVITFALEDDKTFNPEERILGDIYISIDKAKSQSIEYGHSLERELCFLSVHGMLHLLGYDHMEKEEERVMFNLQEEILDEMGIKR